MANPDTFAFMFVFLAIAMVGVAVLLFENPGMLGGGLLGGGIVGGMMEALERWKKRQSDATTADSSS